MKKKAHKPPKTLWVIVYEGPGNTSPSFDVRPVWSTKKSALDAIKRHGLSGYKSVKYTRTA